MLISINSFYINFFYSKFCIIYLKDVSLKIMKTINIQILKVLCALLFAYFNCH